MDKNNVEHVKANTIAELIKSDGYKYLKEEINKTINYLRDIRNIDGVKDEKLINLEARKLTADALEIWLDWIEGTALHSEFSPLLTNERLILRK